MAERDTTITIKSDQQAADLIEAIALYLHVQRLSKNRLDEARQLSREWSHVLLEGADADGLGGCPLCQS